MADVRSDSGRLSAVAEGAPRAHQIERGTVGHAATTLALMVGPGAAAAAEYGTSAPPCPIMQSPRPSVTVQVPGTAGPIEFPGAEGVVDTGVCVPRPVRVTATGSIGIGDSVTFGPEGDTTSFAGPGFVLPGVPPWSLIGRIGNGPWHYIGAGPTTLGGRGELYLAVNDDIFADSSGSFTATVSGIPGSTPSGS